MRDRLPVGGILLAITLSVMYSDLYAAGKNDGGAMLVHTDDAVSWTDGICEQFDSVVPQDYTQLNTRTDKDDVTLVLIWFIAAFHADSDPEVTIVFFGNDHNLPEFYHNRWDWCRNGTTGSFEVPDTGWPEAPATAGSAVSYSQPIVGKHLFPFYYFDVWGFTGAYYGTGINPTGGFAAFVDDSHPPITDRTNKFGQVRWYEEGSNSTPDPPRVGACCLSVDATCVIALESDCQPPHGVYQGDDATCDPELCGACCYWYTADAEPPFFYERRCIVTSEADCADDESWDEHEYNGHGSNWSIPGAVCAASEDEAPDKWWCWDSTLDPDPMGACCYADRLCVWQLWSDCAGQYMGYASDCDPNPCPQGNPGACCQPDGTCEITYANQCPFGFLGSDTQCDPNPCPLTIGACCFNTLCFLENYQDCVGNGGVYVGYDEPCDPNPCLPTPGACCHADGTCSLERFTECDHLFMGWSIPCDPNPCPPMPGACCGLDGSCTFVIEEQCDGDSFYIAIPCEPNPCNPQPSACCFLDGNCELLSEVECTGEFQGYGTVCDPNPCPQPSACCFLDGTCELLSEPECTGDFQGYGTVCEPNPCPQPRGACCFMNLCYELEELECTENWGTYQGDGVPCDPNPCPTSDIAGDVTDLRQFLLLRPNPATESVTISYGITAAGSMSLDVFDASGRRVRQIYNGAEYPGGHTITWDGTDGTGRRLPSGIYYVRLVSGDGVVTRAVMLAR